MPPQFSPAFNINQDDLERITYFALTDARNKRAPFGIKKKDRDRHTYVIGKTGMGKSTLLENMAVQDIQNGEGICFIDPHGGTAEKLMEYIPEDRVKDVLYFAPFDLQYPISFNVLENVDADKRHFVVAGLMSTFEKIWVDAWSARMAYILQNTLGALLEFPGATLLGVNRMYIDKEYRKNVIAHITDPSVRSFWVDEYSKYTDRYTQEATPAIQNKIGQFAANALVRNIIGQEQSAFDMRDLMDHKKIFIVNLSKGRVGEGNTNLLGSMLITKLYLAAMSRADASSSALRQLPYFYLYVDEFQNFANRSFADILSESRKYKLALTIAHQYVEQMEEEVASAVFGNVGTMMAFRVGAYDAEVLEKEFAPTFMMEDLVNLGARQIYLKLMIDGISSQPFSAVTMPPIPEPEVSHKDRAIAFSRATFSKPREEVENAIRDWVGKKYEDPEADEKERARQERRAERDTTGGGPGGQRGPSAGAPSQYRDRPVGQSYDRRPPQGQTRPAQRFDERRDGPPREARVYRQDQETASSTQERPGRPSRDVPRPPRSFEPRERPLPPKAQDQSPQELRSILSRISAQDRPKKPPEHQAQQESRGEGVSVSSAPRAQEPPRPVGAQRDDGKSITPAGRESLKALLSSVAAKPPAAVSSKPESNRIPTHDPTPTRPASNRTQDSDQTPKQSLGHANEQQSRPAHALASHRGYTDQSEQRTEIQVEALAKPRKDAPSMSSAPPRSHTPPPPPPEPVSVPDEDLRRLLRADKPTLE